MKNALLRYGSVVKSVQRGDTTLTGVGGLNNTNKSKKITISPVNIGKSVLIATLHGNPSANASDSSGNSCVVLTDESTITFTLKGGGNCGTVALSWQVIEFY